MLWESSVAFIRSCSEAHWQQNFVVSVCLCLSLFARVDWPFGCLLLGLCYFLSVVCIGSLASCCRAGVTLFCLSVPVCVCLLSVSVSVWFCLCPCLSVSVWSCLCPCHREVTCTFFGSIGEHGVSRGLKSPCFSVPGTSHCVHVDETQN